MRSALLLVVRQHHFFAPVAEDVAAERRVGLGAVVGRGPIRREQARIAARAVLVDMIAVDQLAHRIRVPPGKVSLPSPECDRWIGARGIAQEGHVRPAPQYSAPALPDQISAATPRPGPSAIVVGSGENPRAVAASSAGPRRADCRARGCPRSRGPAREVIEIAHVQRIAVAQAADVHRRAVVVDGHGAKDDFVAAIAVDVGDRQVVIALAGVLAARVVANRTPSAA